MKIKLNIGKKGVIKNTPDRYKTNIGFYIEIEDIGDGAFQSFYWSKDEKIGFNELFLSKDDMEYYFSEEGWEIEWEINN